MESWKDTISNYSRSTQTQLRPIGATGIVAQPWQETISINSNSATSYWRYRDSYTAMAWKAMEGLFNSATSGYVLLALQV